MKRDIIWLAYGLNRQLTGIERVILGLLEHAPPDLRLTERLTIFVDDDAVWPQHLPPEVDIRRVASRSKTPRLICKFQLADNLWEHATLIHSFGALLPRFRHAAVYTVYDWGPFQRHRLRIRPRLIWGLAVAGSIRRATVLHTLTSSTYSNVPMGLRRTVRKLPKLVSLPPPPATTLSTTTDRSQEFPDTPFLLFVGSADPRKRLDTLVHAVSRNPDISLVLAGDGTLRYQGASGITALGRVDESTLTLLYARCSALVLISEMEGLGLPVIEAASMGKMSLVSREVAKVQPSFVSSYLTVVDVHGGQFGLTKSLNDAMTASIRPRLRRHEVDPGFWQAYRDLFTP